MTGLCSTLLVSAAASPSTGRTHGLHIVNGDTVNSSAAYPFVAVQYNGTNADAGQFCGGSLIAARWVLTAAHCVWDGRESELRVKIGVHRRDLRLSAAAEGGVDLDIDDFVVHPMYRRRPYLYDLALLHLAKSASSVATPIELDDGALSTPGTEATVLGWGSHDVRCTSYDPLLRRASVTVASHAACREASGGEAGYDAELVLCAARPPASGGAHGWVETGCGDSGGPLVVRRTPTTYDAAATFAEEARHSAAVRGTHTLVGVVSWGYGHTYDVYMRVAGQLDWIRGVIGRE